MVLEFMQRGQLTAGDPNAFPVLFISSVMQVTALTLPRTRYLASEAYILAHLLSRCRCCA